MTNKKFKKAAMALALTACVAATPLAANAETPENAVPVENKERSEAETPAQQASESANTAPVENQEHENAEGILEDRETEDKKITTDVEYTDREFTYNEDGTVRSEESSVRITQRTPFGNIAQTTTCSRCGGKGQIIDNPCHTCNGQGRVKKVSEKEINVPAGIDDGQTLRVGGEGNCGINGGPNGDLHINITVRPDPIFERDGYDVWTEIPLTYAQATLGDEITVPTVDGKVKYTVPEGTQTGTVFRLRGKGIKKVNRNDHGDHYVRVTVEVPRNLTKEQKEKLRDYEKSLGEKNYAKRKTFFDKLKDKFK